jgi:hypothetical protein
VIALDLAAEHRPYPMQILVHHEIVNDVVGGEPVVVTSAPFVTARSRSTGAWTIERSGSGYPGSSTSRTSSCSNRETFSLWRQLTGQAVEWASGGSGASIPVRTVPFEAWAAAHSVCLVL